ncbi:hypothetical protein MMC25_008353 [Agyrium rufum]|nr:hypothetical protein [Agyrium rufum]
MAFWGEDYIRALEVRDKREQTNRRIIEACKIQFPERQSRAKLIDVVSQLQGLQNPVGLAGNDPSVNGPNVVLVSSLRTDLASAQRSRKSLEDQVDRLRTEVAEMRVRSQSSQKTTTELQQQKYSLSMRLRDRDEELRGKAKLLDDVHDENLSLTLQLNMAEGRSRNLTAENKELIDRWMEKMKQEAESMNQKSEFS